MPGDGPGAAGPSRAGARGVERAAFSVSAALGALRAAGSRTDSSGVGTDDARRSSEGAVRASEFLENNTVWLSD